MPKQLQASLSVADSIGAAKRKVEGGAPSSNQPLERFGFISESSALRKEASLRGMSYEKSLERHCRRGSGSYYTPDYLVDFVLQESLGPSLKGASLDEIFAMRIADLSCGAGAFLMGALEYLERACVEKGAKAGQRLRRRLASCLIGIDLDAQALELCRENLATAIGGDCKSSGARLIHANALLAETYSLPPIDAVVGNPPWGQKGIAISAKEKKEYKKRYRCALGPLDPFKLFIERSLQILPENGVLGLVLPDIILLKNLQETRDLLLEKSQLLSISHCGQAFSGVNLDAVAIVAKKVETPKSEHPVKIRKELRSDWVAKNFDYTQCQGLYSTLPGHSFNLFLEGESLKLFRRLQTFPRLGDVVESHEGVHTGNIRKKLFVEKKAGAACEPVIVNSKEFSPFSLRWAGRYIDTREGLINRSAGEYANLGRQEWHRSQKILVRRTGDRVLAAVEREGRWCSNNFFLLLCQDEDLQELEAICALLNSRLITWFFRALQPRKGRLFAELKLVHLRQFPFPPKSVWDRLRPKLAELCRQAQSGEKQSMLLDRLVESAYGISLAEAEQLKLES